MRVALPAGGLGNVVYRLEGEGGGWVAGPLDHSAEGGYPLGPIVFAILTPQTGQTWLGLGPGGGWHRQGDGVLEGDHSPTEAPA